MIDPAIRDLLDSEHPHFTPDQNRTRHTLKREGDTIFCDCGGEVFAPILPNPPLTPMEASLSRFD